MSQTDQSWLLRGRGISPLLRWSFMADAPLVDLDLARESGETAVADASGSVYLLDGRGQVVTLSRGFSDIQEIAWSDAGNTGAVVSGDTTLSVLNRQLRVMWTHEYRSPIVGIAVAPHGNHIVLSLENAETRILSTGKKVIGEFSSMRPLQFHQFLASEAEFVAAAEHGLICSRRIDGEEVWAETWWSNVGDLSVTGDGKAVFIAGMNLGVQRFDGSGNSLGTYVLEGTPHLVATSYLLKRLAAATIEKGLFWMDADGEIVWHTRAPEEIRVLRCDALAKGCICGFDSGRVVRLDWGYPGD